ncbi:potassium-transporting ATPase subunit C [Corynebacterium mastitidis]|uniref:potassium-transporting ATPase subunit C n=1 Tax=Corynebacterium mastitidis TaxID=161890 RepID=UPI00254F5571|nr:potassium-transporting ATPase subunit C [Corynebacterium mastitidis]MDK8450062.1 potassium-transporting ATPase subunit C [Corynebacterium mastitidis]
MIPFSRVLHTLRAGAVALALFTVLLGLFYPLALAGVGSAFFPRQAAGSLIEDASGRPIGSALLAQQPVSGKEADSWFYPRPSAGEGQASNASPADPAYLSLVEQRRREVSEREGIAPERVPAEALAASGSGLDPHISRAYAEVQAPRVARRAGLPEETVRLLVAQNAQPSALRGSLGSPRSAPVNVTTLNAAVARCRENQQNHPTIG